MNIKQEEFMQIYYINIFVSDIKKSISFYRDILWFTLKFESSEWTEFNTGDITLALHNSEETSNHNKSK